MLSSRQVPSGEIVEGRFGVDHMSHPHHEDRMAAPFAELKEALAVTASTVHERPRSFGDSGGTTSTWTAGRRGDPGLVLTYPLLQPRPRLTLGLGDTASHGLVLQVSSNLVATAGRIFNFQVDQSLQT
jgi:hypothetical protein